MPIASWGLKWGGSRLEIPNRGEPRSI